MTKLPPCLAPEFGPEQALRAFFQAISATRGKVRKADIDSRHDSLLGIKLIDELCFIIY
jgi:hypothetical protein